jgi:hypothetical protein
MRVITLTHGQPGYAGLLDQIRRNPALVAAMWADAESRPDELDVPGTSWSVALVAGAPAAWCAARLQDHGTLKCHSNYEVWAYRGKGRYEAAYAERHRAVVVPAAVVAVTYLFEQPIALHEADGWRKTGLTGTSHEADEPHPWWELHRPATPGH